MTLAPTPNAKHTLVFNGESSHPIATASLKTSLRSFNVQPIVVDASYLERAGWERIASTLVLGGGHGLHMADELTNASKKIQKFVFEGGNYFGICAGAIAAASQFQETPESVILPEDEALYPLKLYAGTIFGPAHLGDSAPRRVAKTWQETVRPYPIVSSQQEELGPFFWNLGPHFDSRLEHQEILAHYSENRLPPAAVHAHYGKGNVVLTGMHPEIIADDSVHPEIKELACFDVLHQNASSQKELFEELCLRSGILGMGNSSPTE